MSAAYRCFFFDRDRKISGFRDIQASSDAEAIVAAKAMAEEHSASAFELWQGTRHLHSGTIGTTKQP
jgi:hypothetical protein